MTIQTPAQIADKLLHDHADSTGESVFIPAPLVEGDVRVWMIDAINADRAQMSRQYVEALAALNARDAAASGQPGVRLEHLDRITNALRAIISNAPLSEAAATEERSEREAEANRIAHRLANATDDDMGVDEWAIPPADVVAMLAEAALAGMEAQK